MRKRTTAGLIGLGLMIGVAWPLSSAASASATTPEEPYTVVLWSVPAGADPLAVDQPYVTSTPGKTLDALDSSMQCGTTYQVDVYRTALDDGTPVTSLWADGVLHPSTDGAFLAYDVLPTPYKVVTTDACAPVVPPKPTDEVRYGTWADEHGAISCDRDTVLQARTVTTVPYVLDEESNTWIVNPDESTWIVTVEERERPKTDEEIKSCDTATPPTDEPTPPVTTPPAPPTESPVPPTVPTEPTPETTPPAPSTPAPSDAPTQAPTSPISSAPTPDATPTVAPVVDDTTRAGTLAYTGSEGLGVAGIVALALAAIGALVLIMRRRARLGGE